MDSPVVTILKSALQKTAVEISLTEPEINYVKSVLEKYPEVFQDINNQFQLIMADGKIDCNDIPQLVLLFSKLYKTHILSENIENIGLINIVKFTIDSLLQSDLLPLPQFEARLVQKLVDSSIDLLQMNTDVIIQKEKACFALFC
jgi:hypothetical protein